MNIAINASSNVASVVAGAVSAIAAFGQGRQSGGPVTAGQPYWVGEAGPELIVPGQDSTVVDAATSMALQQGVSFSTQPGGGGSTVNHFHFSVPPTADLASIGKTIKEAMQAYERRIGVPVS